MSKTLIPDTNVTNGDTIRVSLRNDTGTFIEDKNYQFTGARSLSNAVSSGLINQIKGILESITATIGNVEEGFLDPLDPSKRITLGSRVRNVQTTIDTKLSSTVQGEYIAGISGVGIYRNNGLECALYKVKPNMVGALIQAPKTVPVETVDSNNNYNDGSPISIEGAIQNDANSLYMGPGLVIGKNTSFQTSFYHRVYVQSNTPIEMGFDTGTYEMESANNRTDYSPVPTWDISEVVDLVGKTGKIPLRTGYQFPVRSGIIYGTSSADVLVGFIDDVGTPIATINISNMETPISGESGFVFTYDGNDYYRYEDLLAGMGNSPTPAMMNSVITHLNIINNIPTDLNVKTIILKYAFHPERWVGLAVANSDLSLIYKSVDGTVRSDYFYMGAINSLYDPYLPRPVGSAIKGQLNGVYGEGVMLYDVYVNPLHAYMIANSLYNTYYEQRAGYVQKAIYRNALRDNTFGSRIVDVADNLAISTPLAEVSTWNAGANWTITSVSGEIPVNDNLALQNQYQVDLGFVYERRPDIATSNPEVTSINFSQVAAPSGPTYNFPAQQGSKVCIRLTRGAGSSPITVRKTLKTTAIRFVNGDLFSNVELDLPLTSEVQAVNNGVEPDTIFVFYGHRNGKTQGFLDSALQIPFNLRTDLTVDPNPYEGRGLKSSQLAKAQIYGSATKEDVLTNDHAAKLAAMNVVTGPLVSETVLGTGYVNQIYPKSIGSFDINDQALAERHFPGSELVGGANATHRVRGNKVLRQDSVSITEILRNPAYDNTSERGVALTANDITFNHATPLTKTLATVLKEQLGYRVSGDAGWGFANDNSDLVVGAEGLDSMPPQNANPIVDPANALDALFLPTERFDSAGAGETQGISSTSRQTLIDTINYLAQRIKHLEDNVIVKKTDTTSYIWETARPVPKFINMHDGMIPIGGIVDFLPGSFVNGTNGSYVDFADVLTAGSAAAWLNAKYPNWRICNGSSISDAESPLDGRMLPNLSDARFTMGGTSSIAMTGGNNVMNNHSHAATTSSRAYLGRACVRNTGGANGWLRFLIGGSFTSGVTNYDSAVNLYTDASQLELTIYSDTTVGAGTDPRSGVLDNRPLFMVVYKIMRIK